MVGTRYFESTEKVKKRIVLKPLETAYHDFFRALDISRPPQIVINQYVITIMGGREVSRPYRILHPTVLLRYHVLWGAVDEGFYIGDEDVHQAHACFIACPADVWGDVAARLCQQWVGG